MEKTNTSTFERPFEKKNKCHHTAEQPKPQSPAHTKIVIVSNNNGRHCDPSIPSTYSILLLFFHSLFHCSAEKKTTLEPNCSDFHRHLYMQRYLYPSLQPFSLARSPAIGCLWLAELHRIKNHLFIRKNCNFSCAFSSFYSIIPLYCEIISFHFYLYVMIRNIFIGFLFKLFCFSVLYRLVPLRLPFTLAVAVAMVMAWAFDFCALCTYRCTGAVSFPL